MKFEVPEPEEWEKYVEKGDLHPQKPVWDLPENRGGQGHQKHPQNEGLKLGQRRLSAKDKAHMDFIKSGKNYRK